MIFTTQKTVMKTLAALAAPLFFIGCNVPTVENSEHGHHSSSSSDILLACLSVKASVVALSDTAVSISGNGSIKGRVILLGRSTLDVSGNAEISDEVCTRSSDNITSHGHASPGVLRLEDFTDHEGAVLDFSHQLQSLTPTQVINQISSTQQLSGNGSLNVIEIKHGIRLSGKSSLSFHGGKKDKFIVLVDESGIDLSGQAEITVSGGIPARKVLFLISGKNSFSLTGNGSVAGTFFAPTGSAMISGNGHLEGAILAQGNISLTGNGLSFTPAAWCPQFESSEEQSNSNSGDPSTAPSPCPSSVSDPSTTPSGTPTTDPTSTPSTTPSTTPSPNPSATPTTAPSPSPTVPPGPPSLIS
jgi:hypothetical protein